MSWFTGSDLPEKGISFPGAPGRELILLPGNVCNRLKINDLYKALAKVALGQRQRDCNLTVEVLNRQKGVRRQ